MNDTQKRSYIVSIDRSDFLFEDSQEAFNFFQLITSNRVTKAEKYDYNEKYYYKSKESAVIEMKRVPVYETLKGAKVAKKMNEEE